MSILTRKLPTFTGVSPGQTATCEVPSGYAYHSFFMRLKDGDQSATLNPSDISEIRLVANGQVIQRWSGDDLDAANKFDGFPAYNWSGQAFNQYIALTCVRNHLKTRASQEATALPFGALNDPRPITSLLIEVDLDSGTPQNCAIEGYALVSARPDLGGVPATLKMVRKFQYSPTAAGEFDIANLPRIGAISRIFFAEQAGGATGIKDIIVQADSVEIWNRTDYLNRTIIKAYDWRVVQDRFFAIDTTEQGNGNDFWDISGVSDFRLKLNMTGAKDLNCIVEYLAPLGS